MTIDQEIREKANKRMIDETDFQPTNFATETFHVEEETRSTTSANQTSNNQEHIPFINEELDDEYKPGILFIQPEKGVILV